jgi:hypothetical protein
MNNFCKRRSILINSEISRCYFLTYLLNMYAYVHKGKKIEGSIKKEVWKYPRGNQKPDVDIMIERKREKKKKLSNKKAAKHQGWTRVHWTVNCSCLTNVGLIHLLVLTIKYVSTGVSALVVVSSCIDEDIIW